MAVKLAVNAPELNRTESKKPCEFCFTRLFIVCGRRDLNPYPLLDTPLKRARMPIPPRPQNSDDYKDGIAVCQG